MALASQLILRARDNRVLAPDLVDRRRWSHTLAFAARGRPLLAHGLADTHAHLLLACDRDEAGLHTRHLARTLHLCLGPELEWEPVRFSPVRDQAHLASTFGYVLGQLGHHGLDELDPFFEGTALPDLLGLRPSGAWMAGHVRRLLPRVKREELLARFGGDPWACCERRLSTLVQAVAAAAGLPTAQGNEPLRVDARAAGIRLARQGHTIREVADALGLSIRTVKRLSAREPSTPMLRAVEGQWAWRSQGRGQKSHPQITGGTSVPTARRSGPV